MASSVCNQLLSKSDHEQRLIMLLICHVGLLCFLISEELFVNVDVGKPLGSTNTRRVRVDVRDLFTLLGPALTRRAYRMTESSFWNLFDLVKPFLASPKKRKRGATPNGDIKPESRLSMALRWFAGGDPLDIMQTHGVGPTEVLTSVWRIVDAVNACPQLQMHFPIDLEGQRSIANGFEKKSHVGFDNCVGCIDGMLVWIHKPSKRALEKAGFGPKKFFCGRKKKFGLNLQAICDHNRKFLDIDIVHPGSTSDYLCFSTSAISDRLENQGLLHEGFTIFGDNAYVNSPFMTTPFKNVSDGTCDAFNFHHSQLRINIECAFGMLVHKWGVLRKPFPVNVSIEKIAQAVRALCLLHNFCIDERLGSSEPTASDALSIVSSGGFSHPFANQRVQQLMDGGEHWEGVPESSRRRRRREAEVPRDRLMSILSDKKIHSRPNPKGSTSTNN